MEKKRPLILISNDDGYQAKGINSLVDFLAPLADILVCAPDGPRSGFSCAFSAEQPLRLTPHPSPLTPHRSQNAVPFTTEVWSCNGTPVDCVKMALENILDRRPDMVIGGINHGDNSSVNSHYSGTMGVVMEGCMKYIPSVAFSLCDHRPDADFEPLRPYIVDITRHVLDHGLPKGSCLNVNFPGPEDGDSICETPGVDRKNREYRGVRICRMTQGHWANETIRCHHKRGYDYWWMVGNFVNDEPDAEDTDRWALAHGYVAVTPTTFDVTDYEAMEQLKVLATS